MKRRWGTTGICQPLQKRLQHGRLLRVGLAHHHRRIQAGQHIQRVAQKFDGAGTVQEGEFLAHDTGWSAHSSPRSSGGRGIPANGRPGWNRLRPSLCAESRRSPPRCFPEVRSCRRHAGQPARWRAARLLSGGFFLGIVLGHVRLRVRKPTLPASGGIPTAGSRPSRRGNARPVGEAMQALAGALSQILC